MPLHNGILLSHGKELSNATAATWTDLEMIILSRTEKGNPHALSLACGPQTMAQTNLTPKETQIRLQVPRAEGRLGTWDEQVQSTTSRTGDDKDLLHSTGSHVQSLG